MPAMRPARSPQVSGTSSPASRLLQNVACTRSASNFARAQGMTQIARDAGLGRESLYKALSATGNPEFATIMKVMKALGLKLHATAI